MQRNSDRSANRWGAAGAAIHFGGAVADSGISMTARFRLCWSRGIGRPVCHNRLAAVMGDMPRGRIPPSLSPPRDRPGACAAHARGGDEKK